VSIVWSSRRSCPLGILGLTLFLGLSPNPLFAQIMDPISPVITVDTLRTQAAEFEKKGQWQAALQAYFHLMNVDRQNNEVREKVHLCLRHVLQSRRHRDKSFQEKILTLSEEQVSHLYAEVLDKLQGIYVDRNKCQINQLFRAGLEEFSNALKDSDFREKHLKQASESAIRDFQRRLMDAWADRTVKNIREARSCVNSISRAAQQQLKISNNAVVLEFLCGACNALDEYTTYLTPADLASDLEESNEPSVVDASILKDGIAYLRISYFRDSTATELDNALATLKGAMMEKPIKSLIIDLRGNIGGTFDAAVQVAERFLAQGVIVSTMGQTTDSNKIFTPTPGNPVLDVGVVVLVDGQTASAAEVLAFALRDHQRAKIIGTPTFGKGSIQKVFKFSTAEEVDEHGKPKNRTGAIRITFARIFSPNGQAISGGITPHIIATEREDQMVAALQEAARFTTLMRP
jgi:hypothetical protein